jgi:hypothetical protein
VDNKQNISKFFLSMALWSHPLDTWELKSLQVNAAPGHPSLQWSVVGFVKCGLQPKPGRQLQWGRLLFHRIGLCLNSSLKAIKNGFVLLIPSSVVAPLTGMGHILSGREMPIWLGLLHFHYLRNWSSQAIGELIDIMKRHWIQIVSSFIMNALMPVLWGWYHVLCWNDFKILC